MNSKHEPVMGVWFGDERDDRLRRQSQHPRSHAHTALVPSQTMPCISVGYEAWIRHRLHGTTLLRVAQAKEDAISEVQAALAHCPDVLDGYVVERETGQVVWNREGEEAGGVPGLDWAGHQEGMPDGTGGFRLEVENGGGSRDPSGEGVVLEGDAMSTDDSDRYEAWGRTGSGEKKLLGMTYDQGTAALVVMEAIKAGKVNAGYVLERATGRMVWNKEGEE